MSCRVIPCSFLAACLAIGAVALWLPGDVASGRQSEAEPEPATSEAKLIAAECAFVVTFKPADFNNDELVKGILRDVPRAIEEELHTPIDGLARLTMAVARLGAVQIIRTKRPYDAEKLRQAMTESRYGRMTAVKDKRIGGELRKPAIGEKMAGGKKIFYLGTLERWTQGWCPIDKTGYMIGSVEAIQSLLETKGKPSAEMADALALAPKHSLVLALDGTRMRSMFRQQREDREREEMEWRKRREERYKDTAPGKDTKGVYRGTKSLGGPTEIAIRTAPKSRGVVGEKAGEDDIDLLLRSADTAIVGLPYRPLLEAKFGLGYGSQLFPDFSGLR